MHTHTQPTYVSKPSSDCVEPVLIRKKMDSRRDNCCSGTYSVIANNWAWVVQLHSEGERREERVEIHSEQQESETHARQP